MGMVATFFGVTAMVSGRFVYNRIVYMKTGPNRLQEVAESSTCNYRNAAVGYSWSKPILATVFLAEYLQQERYLGLTPLPLSLPPSLLPPLNSFYISTDSSLQNTAIRILTRL